MSSITVSYYISLNTLREEKGRASVVRRMQHPSFTAGTGRSLACLRYESREDSHY